MDIDKPTLEELITDESFIDYCLQRNEDAKRTWEILSLQHPEHQQDIDEAKRIVIGLAYRPTEAEKAAEKVKLLAFLEGQVSNERQPKRLFVFGRWVAAASIVFAIGIAALWYMKRPSPMKNIEVSLVKQYVPAGKLMNLRLQDGTEVRLTSATEFAYPETFADSAREVQLQGEAFFDVADDASKPFVIRTGNFSIRVLGTSFNVHAFEQDEKMQVSLFRGKVEVSHGQTKQILEPGQSFVYDKSSETASISTFNETEEQARMRGVLFFDRADFNEVGLKLSRKYGIQVPADPHVHITFSGRIENETIEQVIDKLNFTTSYQFLLQSNTLIVKHK